MVSALGGECKNMPYYAYIYYKQNVLFDYV